jgi:hypothetical protein
MSGEIVTGSAANPPWEGFTCGTAGQGYFTNMGEGFNSQAITLCSSSPFGVVHIQQSVALEPGKYILSWYGASGQHPYGFRLRTAAGTNVPAAVSVDGPLSDKGFPRYYDVYDITTAGTYQVYADGLGNGTTGWNHNVGLPMLEKATTANLAEGSQIDYRPLPFELTDADGKHQVEWCSDTDGSSFRFKHWKRECLPVCDNGIGTGCVVSLGPPRCFLEASFDLNQRDIENGYILPNGGFALGNFNYRVEALAVNFVGTSLRTCESTGGQGCYSQGFIPYSLVQSGPFTVINHAGDPFYSTLYDGHIEHAKGLALERYLSNPLSSADNGLIEPFIRKEFMGRPLDGAYVLRVWEEPGVDFNSIEDVQILLKYRYWTRLN